jgi:HEAT repeat protein
MLEPQNDPRCVDDLVTAVLAESDEDLAWNAVAALHWRGSREVLNRAAALAASPCSRERRVAADILGQLGVPERTFPEECFSILHAMCRDEQDVDVLQAILVAFSHLRDVRAIPLAAAQVRQASADVRHAVVLALTGHDDQRAIDGLIGLSRDEDGHVRDWATFALGTQLKLDTPQIRDALADRLYDADDEARGEAMIGLARRCDDRVIPAIQHELSSDSIIIKAFEAAELLESPQLLPQLIALRGMPNDHPGLLEEVIAACSQADC